jgi:hypothetical protein
MRVEYCEVKVATAVYTGKQVKPEVTVYHPTGGGSELKDQAGRSLARLKYGPNINIGPGWIDISCKGGSDFSIVGNKRVYFKIVPSKVTASKPIAGKRSFKIQWKKVSSRQKVTGYEVSYRSSSSKSWKSKTVKASKKALTIKKLKKGTYKVRVRAYKIVGGEPYNGPWSKTRTVKVVK